MTRSTQPVGATNSLALRRHAADYVLGLEAGQQVPQRHYKDMWEVGTDDYEAWRKWRMTSHRHGSLSILMNLVTFGMAAPNFLGALGYLTRHSC